MSELTKDKLKSTWHLILGFDAECGACSALAGKIAQIDDRIKLESLNDVQMQSWREQTLGKEAPWRPTLIELANGQVEAYTGFALGMRISWRLGPKAAWRIMQVIGEHGSTLADKNADARKHSARIQSSFTRSGFIRGIAGTILAASLLSGTNFLATPSPAYSSVMPRSLHRRELKGSALSGVCRKAARTKDVINLMGSEWSQRLRSSKLASYRIDDYDVELLHNDNIPRTSEKDFDVLMSNDSILVKGGRHELKDGSKVLVVIYVQDNRLLIYQEFDELFDGAKSKAQVWEMNKQSDTVSLVSESSNGILTSSVPSSTGKSLAIASVNCGGCSSSRRRRAVRGCTELSYRCLALNCGFCIVSAPGIIKLACVYFYCAYLVTCGTGTCCKPRGCSTGCAGCAQ